MLLSHRYTNPSIWNYLTLVDHTNHAQGCGVRIVDHRTQVYMPLHKTADTAHLRSELEKLNKKKAKVVGDLDRLAARTASPFYLEKVPLEVREKDRYST